MKKTKSLIALMAFALTFACVMSCNEQDEKLMKEAELTSEAIPAGRVTNPDFNGSEGNSLDLATAKKWTANYRGTLKNPDEISAHYFGFEIIQQILNESSCVGIRIYYAMDDRGEKKLILVGVNSKGENLLPVAGGKLADGDITADASLPCPDYCPGNGL